MIAKEPIVPSNKDDGKIDSFYTGEDQYYDELEAEEARLEKEAEKEQAEYEKQLDAEKAQTPARAEESSRDKDAEIKQAIEVGRKSLGSLWGNTHIGAHRTKRVESLPGNGRVTSRLEIDLDKISREGKGNQDDSSRAETHPNLTLQDDELSALRDRIDKISKLENLSETEVGELDRVKTLYDRLERLSLEQRIDYLQLANTVNTILADILEAHAS